MLVRTLFEGMALFSSNTHNYGDLVEGEELNVTESVRERLMVTLKYIENRGSTNQTWRVYEHRKLGWVDAPILLTATRVK